jgi:hypothetical protein
MRFQVNDIVSSAPGWRAGVFQITAINPSRPKNPYEAINLVNGKVYRLGDESLASKRIGVADLQTATTVTVNTPASSSQDYNYQRGQSRIRAELSALAGNGGAELEVKRWEKLLSLKPGDKFPCRVRGKLDRLSFLHVTDRGYKYVFVAENSNGTRYKYPLAVIVVD